MQLENSPKIEMFQFFMGQMEELILHRQFYQTKESYISCELAHCVFQATQRHNLASITYMCIPYRNVKGSWCRPNLALITCKYMSILNRNDKGSWCRPNLLPITCMYISIPYRNIKGSWCRPNLKLTFFKFRETN